MSLPGYFSWPRSLTKLHTIVVWPEIVDLFLLPRGNLLGLTDEFWCAQVGALDISSLRVGRVATRVSMAFG